MKISFYPCDPWAVGWYRSRQPARVLKELGYDAEVYFGVGEVADGPIKDDVLYAGIDGDIHVFQRVYNPSLIGLMKELKNKGKKIVLDLDDNLFDVPSWNTAYTISKITRKYNIEALGLADITTVANERLVELYKPHAKHIKVFRNYTDVKMFQKAKKEVPDHSHRVIGWAGSMTHRKDLELIRGVFNSLPKDYDYEIRVTGDRKEVMDQALGTTEYVMMHPVPVDEYHKLIAEFDIGLAPLEISKFTSGKSELKVKEYCSVGAPVFASKSPSYSDFIQPGVNGFLVGRNDWVKALKRAVIMPEEELMEMSENAVKFAWKHDIYKNIHRLVKIYESL